MSKSATVSLKAWISLVLLALVSAVLGIVRTQPGQAASSAELLGQVAGAAAAPWIVAALVAAVWLGVRRALGKSARFLRVFLWVAWIFAVLSLLQAVINLVPPG